MTTLDNNQANISALPETTDDIDGGAADDGPAVFASTHPHFKLASTLHKLRALEQRAIELPVVGKLHAPNSHDVAYVAGMAALLAFGAVELPIALVLLGGHVLVKQHQSRYLSDIGEVLEDVWGHQI